MAAHTRRPRGTSALGVSLEQQYGDSPMRITFVQTHRKDGMEWVERGVFIVDANDALLLVATLAPLAGRMRKAGGQTQAGLRDDHEAGEHRADPIAGCRLCVPERARRNAEKAAAR